MILRDLLSPSPSAPDPVLDDMSRVAILCILCVVEADLTFICEEMQIAWARHYKRVCFGAEEIKIHITILKQHGYIEEQVQTFGEIPWPLAVLFEALQIHPERGSYKLYRVTQTGRKALRVHCRHFRDAEQFEWSWR